MSAPPADSPSATAARRYARIAALAGLALAIALIASRHAAEVFQALARVGPWLVPIALYHLLPLTLATLGLGVLFTERRPAFRTQLRVNWVREAVNSLLPVTQVGGEVVGARILALRGVSPAVAGAVMVVDLTTETLSQLLFALLGVATLLLTGHRGSVADWAVAGVLVAIPAVAAFVFAQRRGLFLVLENALERLAARVRWIPSGALKGLHDAIQMFYAQPRRMLVSLAWHTIAWLVGTFETWALLRLMGHPVSVADAFIVESLGQAIRSAAFAVPGGFGVQEGGFMLLATVIGVPADVGLAVSLGKRVREALLGVPALLSWQWLESRRMMGTRPARPAVSNDT